MSNGLTDEIINHLYKIKSFDKVVSLSSVLSYKGTDKKIPQIANQVKAFISYADAYASAGLATLMIGGFIGGDVMQSVVWNATMYYLSVYLHM